MQSVSHREVQELIMRLPEKKLSTAYKMMQDLLNDKNDEPEIQPEITRNNTWAKRSLITEIMR